MATLSFTLNSDAEIVGPNSFTLTSDAEIAPPNSFELTSDALILPASAFALTSDAVIGIVPFTGMFSLTSDALIVESKAHGHGVRPPQERDDCRTCGELPCPDESLEDFYSLQGPVFGFGLDCPPGFLCVNETFSLVCCDRVLSVTIPPTATIPQREEIIKSFLRECLRLEQFCDDDCPPNCPPPPPPGFWPPPECVDCGPPPPPVIWYFNTPQQCSVNCPLGGTYVYTIAAGRFLAISRDKANRAAHAEACRLARAHQICLEPKEIEICAGEDSLETIQATGALARFPETNFWEVIGTLPPGMSASTGGSTSSFLAISGTPTTPGDYPITVKVTVVFRGDSQSRNYIIKIKSCPADYGNIVPAIDSSTPTYWNDGDDLPAGAYRISYVTGAWKSPGDVWLVGDGVVAGGKARGYYINTSGDEVTFPTSGLYSSQADAEVGTAGLFINIAHSGGKIGMFLWDSPYNDNTDGSPNPTFQLQKL